MFESILVVLDSVASSGVVLDRALAVVDPQRGRLSLMAVTSRPYALCIPTLLMPPLPTTAELEREAEVLLECGASLVGDRAPLATLIRDDRLVDAIVHRVTAADHDAVVIGAWSLRGLQWPITSRRTASVVRRANVPFLLVPRP